MSYARCFGMSWAIVLVGFGVAAEPVRVASPDGGVGLTLTVDGGRLSFAVGLKDAAVVESSPIVFTVDGADLGREVEIGAVERYQIDESYSWRGGHSTSLNRCNGAKVALRHGPTKTSYTLEARVFDSGVGWRILLPADGERQRTPDEASVFKLPAGSTVWYHDLGGHYEAPYEKKAVAEVPAGQWAAPPVTFKLPGGAGYGSIAEAALRNYSGMALEADGKGGLVIGLGHRHPINVPFRLRYGEEEHKRLSKPAGIAGAITTPWRVVLVGRDLNALVNSDVIHNLCPPPDPELFPQSLATAWIKPGRAVWKYLDGGASTPDEMMAFNRAAGELGFEHHVIEGFWRRWDDAQLKAVVEDGRRHGVGVWLWVHSRNLRTPEARAEFFKRVSDAGAVGVKIDFFDHEAREVVDLYEVMLRDAARHKLMVNFHGANKPTGEARTWPNELTREAVRGMESSRMRERARHDATLPFTRLLAGHADYTPVHFGERRADTTLAHQVASAAVLDSSLLTYGAQPKKLLESPAVEMIKSIPATWDQTIVLEGSEIGEVAALARRKGQTWFVAVLNGPAARKLEVRLAFLGEGRRQAMIVKDAQGEGAAASDLAVEKAVVEAGGSFVMNLRSGGGFVARSTPRSDLGRARFSEREFVRMRSAR